MSVITVIIRSRHILPGELTTPSGSIHLHPFRGPYHIPTSLHSAFSQVCLGEGARVRDYCSYPLTPQEQPRSSGQPRPPHPAPTKIGRWYFALKNHSQMVWDERNLAPGLGWGCFFISLFPNWKFHSSWPFTSTFTLVTVDVAEGQGQPVKCSRISICEGSSSPYPGCLHNSGKRKRFPQF